MSSTSSDRITLTGSQRRELQRLTRAGRTEQRLAVRAKIVLAASMGESNAQIARSLRVCEDTVRKWRRRWCAAPGLAALGDAKRSGRRPAFTPVQVARVKALACTPPAGQGLPLSRWSRPQLARHAVDDGICASISPATVRRWLSEDALKPWQYQSWIFITDPDFAAKAARVLALYDRTWEGKPLGCNDYVISADEKTSIQARCRCHPTLPPGKARQIRVNHDYHRRGAIAYLAAYDVHRGQVFGRCQDTTGIAAFEQLVDQVMTTEPYASAERVFWIVDNVSSHRGQATTRPARRPVPQRDHGAHTGTRVMAEPGRDLLLHRATESALAQRLHRPRRRLRPPGRVRGTLQPDRATIQMEIHHRRPRRPAHQARQTQTRADTRSRPTTRSLTPDELTGETT